MTSSRVPILWLHGADAVGKSTVAWEIYERVGESGVPTVYVDTDYLGFSTSLPSGDPTGLVASKRASMWPNFKSAGARCLVVAGIVVSREQRDLFRATIPDAELRLCRLRARPETQAGRILRRGRVEGAETDGAVSVVEGLDAHAEPEGQLGEGEDGLE